MHLMPSWRKFRNSVAVWIRIFHRQVFANSHFHFLTTVGCAKMRQMPQCAWELWWKIKELTEWMSYCAPCNDSPFYFCDVRNITCWTSFSEHHLLNITYWTSLTERHLLNITYWISLTEYHLLNITYRTSLTERHLLNITYWTLLTEHHL